MSWKPANTFYLHVKQIDSAGEDGDFDHKVSLIEQVDHYYPAPAGTGTECDHCHRGPLHAVPLEVYSRHPVPTLLWSAHCRTDPVEQFGERACMRGGLGPRFPAVELLPPSPANALRLEKFGA